MSKWISRSTSAKFQLTTKFTLTSDQAKAVSSLTAAIEQTNVKYQLLYGLTGSGKTLTVASVITNLQKKTLIILHNKILAQQIYEELKRYLPTNKIHYYVSNFDFYQPEAYLPHKNLYLEKVAKMNNYIEMLRARTVNDLLIAQDVVVVVASVSAIYGTISPNVLTAGLVHLRLAKTLTPLLLTTLLIKLGFKRTHLDLTTGTFKIARASVFWVMPCTEDGIYLRIELANHISITKLALCRYPHHYEIESLSEYYLFPTGYIFTDKQHAAKAIARIRTEADKQIARFDKEEKFVEKQRLSERIAKDIDEIKEFHTCSGIENYSAHFEMRERGEPPSTLIDFFDDDWLLIIDESHVTLPQIAGMYAADQSRKQALVDYGFRLPSALDNRPLNITEFHTRIKNCIFVSATPSVTETDLSKNHIAKQLLRPTWLLEPEIFIKGKDGQLLTICKLLDKSIKRGERSIIITATKISAEEVAEFLQERKYKCQYLHGEIKTFKRAVIINALRKGIIDVLVGVNLLREGLDIPELANMIILDADKEGFLRNKTSLLQMFGRVTRNLNGRVYLFANIVTKSIQQAIDVSNANRKIQKQYNEKHHLVPYSIIKPISPVGGEEFVELKTIRDATKAISVKKRKQIIGRIQLQMIQAAKNFQYEKAIKLRNYILELDPTILRNVKKGNYEKGG